MRERKYSLNTIQRQIIWLRAELRRWQAELRLAEAEERDRQRLENLQDAGSDRPPKRCAEVRHA